MRSGPPSPQDGAPSPRESALSLSQQRLWVLDRLYPRNPVHLVACGFRLTGQLDAGNFASAWREVVQQQEILRTEFHAVEGTPQPVIVPSSSPQLNLVDLEAVSPEHREAKLSQLARKEVRLPFDLSGAPLLRASLFRVAPLEHMFLLVAHRIACDAASLGVLVRQLATSYGGDAGTALQAPMQYREYVASHNGPSEEHISYWRQRLAGAPFSFDLPIDRPRPSEQTFRGASQIFLIEKRVADQLRSFGQERGTTLFLTLLATFNLLLSRHSRQEDFVVGTAISGRGDPTLANVVGPLANMIPLRADFSGLPTFSELLSRIRHAINEAFSHQVPVELLLEQLPMERDLGRNPLFQFAFNQAITPETMAVAGMRWESVPVETETEPLDLTLTLLEREEEVEIKFSYSTELFDASTIARMIGHLQNLLQSAAENPQHPVSQLPLLTDVERHQILVEWNCPTANFPANECIHELVEAQVKRTPHAVAVTFNGQSLTYDDLNRRANKLAHYLHEIGVRPDARVAMCMERGFEMIVATLAILKAGGGYVPLDPAYPAERLKYMLADSSATALLTEAPMRTLFDTDASNLPVIDLGDANPPWKNQADTNLDSAGIGLAPHHLAYVIYTSGSTGAPKGVMVEHRNVTRLFTATDAWYYFDASDVWSLFHSYAFDFSVWEIWGALFYGGRLVIVPQNTARAPEEFYSLICREGVTVLNQTPSAFRQLITAQSKGSESHNLRYVIFGGEALEVATLKPWYQQNRESRTQLVNMYGITETTVHVTYRPLEPADIERRGASPIGVRIPDLRTYILDNHRQPVPVGVVGELYVGGAGVARGYLNRPELTAQRFLDDPFTGKTGHRMYKAGDLVRWLTDGTIEFLGRNDFQVKIRGFRIELGEIEARLAAYPGVLETVVIAREDTPGEKRLVAYYTCESQKGQNLTAEQLRTHVAAKLPEYMVPAAYVQLTSMPLTQNGKLNTKALPLPGGDAYAAREYEAPQGETETILTSIWGDVLKLDKVGRHDNFFDLGGHSLTATRLLSQVKEITGRQIPLSALLRGATIESLARLIGQQHDGLDPVATKIQSGDGSRLPFFAIVPPGEESIGYAMLARHMVAQTVYKIQGHAPIVAPSRPYSREEMQQITEEYVAAIRSVLPHGPYCLGGLCDGTHIAEQIVLSLEAQGEEVGLFAIFDTWVMQHSQIRWLWKVDYYRQRLRQMKKMNLTEWLASYKRVAENKVDHLLGKKAPRTDWYETYWPEDFTPTRFRAPVILFKRPKQQFYYINDPQMGWGRRSESGVEIHEVDFHHMEILREPHVRRFGETLVECMERVNQRNLQESSAENQQTTLTLSGQQEQQGS